MVYISSKICIPVLWRAVAPLGKARGWMPLIKRELQCTVLCALQLEYPLKQSILVWNYHEEKKDI